jgi:hypothetical protein
MSNYKTAEERSRIKIKVDGEKQIIDAELPTHKEAL